ncbi:MAG: hypothetical protein AB1632_14725 [Nitrospirota bacterium]
MIAWIRKHLGWIAAIILGGLCIFFIDAWIDSRITITYMDQEHKDRCREIKVLQSLLLEAGKQMNRSEIEQIVTKRFGKDYLIKKDEEDELSVDNVVLKFKGDSLVAVKTYGE